MASVHRKFFVLVSWKYAMPITGSIDGHMKMRSIKLCHFVKFICGATIESFKYSLYN